MILLKLMFSVEMIILELMELFFLRTKSDDKHPAKKLRSQSDAFTWKYDCFCLTKRVLVDEQNNAHIIFQDS